MGSSLAFYGLPVQLLFSFCRDAPEPTGEEPEDADLEAPKIYELVNPQITFVVFFLF